MSHKISQSDKRLKPEEVSKDNSDLWRYSPDLFSALRKEKFSKADPAAFIDYLDALGELGANSPYDEIDFQMDLDTFRARLSEEELEIFNLLMLGMNQREIAEVVGFSQRTISSRITKIHSKFKKFYDRGVILWKPISR